MEQRYPNQSQGQRAPAGRRMPADIVAGTYRSADVFRAEAER